MNPRKLLTGLLATGAIGAAIAYGEYVPVAPPAASGSTSVLPAMTLGEVRKVEPKQGKVTIKHEPIRKLAMPSMTMVFRAEQPKVLQDLRPGDKIRFQAESVRGMLFVTRIELAK